MPRLIFLTGFRGSGKSYAAKQWENVAFRIDGDHLFSASLLELRPELPDEKRNDWSLWPKPDRTPETAARILGVTLPREFPQIMDHRGHVIADGAIFANDWFREGLIGRLKEGGHGFEEVHLLYADLPDEELFRNIRARAEAEPGRRHELGLIRTVVDVTRDNAGFRRCFGRSLPQWIAATSRQELGERLGELLKG